MGEPSAVFRTLNLDFGANCIGGEKTAPGLSFRKGNDAGNRIKYSNCWPFSSKCTGSYSKAETQSAQVF